jgi:hypothetical protein
MPGLTPAPVMTSSGQQAAVANVKTKHRRLGVPDTAKQKISKPHASQQPTVTVPEVQPEGLGSYDDPALKFVE